MMRQELVCVRRQIASSVGPSMVKLRTVLVYSFRVLDVQATPGLDMIANLHPGFHP